MRRYAFLHKEIKSKTISIFRSVISKTNNKKKSHDFIYGLLTDDERIKIGRRILIAQMLYAGFTYDQIQSNLNVGKSTVINVSKKIERYPNFYEKIVNSKLPNDKGYYKAGGSKLIFKKWLLKE